MEEKVVLTPEELLALRMNQEQVEFLSHRYGDLHFQTKYMLDEMKNLESTMDTLMQDRTKMIQGLQEMYGAGTLDLTTGEFVKA